MANIQDGTPSLSVDACSVSLLDTCTHHVIMQLAYNFKAEKVTSSTPVNTKRWPIQGRLGWSHTHTHTQGGEYFSACSDTVSVSVNTLS